MKYIYKIALFIWAAGLVICLLAIIAFVEIIRPLLIPGLALMLLGFITIYFVGLYAIKEYGGKLE